MRRPTGAVLGAVVAAAVSYGSAPVANAQDERSSREHVLELLRQVPLIDGHNDVPWQYRTRVSNHLDEIDFRDTTALEPPMHTDLRRLKQGGVGAQFWSVYIPTSYTGAG
ncbi:MAG: membrane dipeptidase, partial [Acidobacteria bacterium]|nr:membrane dipeptidase [Acidobacteriota bacterium]